jgi:hypothetical protein
MSKEYGIAVGVMTLILVLAFILSVPVSGIYASGMSVSRTLPSSASPGDVVTVRLDVKVGSASYYAIDEQVPAGWEIINTTGDTTQKGHVKWLVISGAKDTTYTYSVKIPANASGKAFFSGTYQMEGMSAPAEIGGDNAIQIYATGFGVARILPMEANAGDNITVQLDVKVGSATYYTIDEKVPSGWEILSAPGGGDYASEKGHIKWIVLSGAKDTEYTYTVKIPGTASGSYTFSGYYAFERMPEMNIEGDEDISVIKAGVMRVLPPKATPNSVIEVKLYVKVGTANHYTIDEQVPDGWIISDAGSGDTTEIGHIKWVVLSNAKDTTYIYKVQAPADAGIYSFKGKYMLAGMPETADIYGDRDISVSAGIVTRSLPSVANAGDEVTVRLDVDVGTADSYLIDEQVPTGWNISNTSGDTTEKWHVKWNVASGAVNTSYCYNMSIPFDASGKFFFEGNYIFENMSKPAIISGDNCIDVQGAGVSRILPSAATPNSTISVELDVKVGLADSYLIDEQVPTGWIISNTSGVVSEEGHVKWNVTSGAVDTVYTYELKVPGDSTGVHHFTGEYMLEGMATPNNIRGAESIKVATGIVTRDLPSTATQGSTIEVKLDARVGGADYYTIDEEVPSGWEIVDTSGDTTQEGHVKWIILTNATNTTHTYNVRIPADITGEYAFNGSYMFEGMTSEETIKGDRILKVEEKKLIPCFIATAAYGTPLHEDIEVLRDFRDEYLMTNPVGREFVKLYYETSPPIAEVISEHEWLRTIVREGFVKPLVYILNLWERYLLD